MLRGLDPQTRLYPGHDYTLKNSAMAHHLLPDDPHIQRAYLDAQDHQARQNPAVLMQEQLRTNVFLRYDEDALLDSLRTRFAQVFDAQASRSEDLHEQVWRTLRALRDAWNGQGFDLTSLARHDS